MFYRAHFAAPFTSPHFPFWHAHVCPCVFLPRRQTPDLPRFLAPVSDESGTKKYQLDEDILEASWDYDFTNVKDGGIVWACDVDGKELAFDSKDSAALESQHTNGGGRGAVNVRSGKKIVDLARMVQVNKVTKVERTVQRWMTNRTC